MRANEILSDKLFALKPGDRCSKALELMNEWQVSHLPVALNNRVTGYVTSDEIAFPEEEDDIIEKYIRNEKAIKVGEQIHLLDLVKFFAESSVSCMAVVDETDMLKGIVDVKDVLRELNEFFSFSVPGSILTIEMSSFDYSISELGRLVESNDLKITGLHIRHVKGTENRLEIVLKLNRNDIRGLLATLSRYNYQVTSETVNQEDLQHLKDRYDSFIKYLNI
ncbi:MAG: CBS domain-containing protein [Bacteroidia bacterium]|nr:CBS domain-containing protein [Bacteroidia bacterium]